MTPITDQTIPIWSYYPRDHGHALSLFAQGLKKSPRGSPVASRSDVHPLIASEIAKILRDGDKSRAAWYYVAKYI
jgi:hypothetical protein